jgi:acyl-CoA thioester hydrolase
VEWRDVDPWGHINNSVYLSYIEDCGMQIAAAYDWPWKKMKENNFGIIARQHHIEYKAQAYLDDELLIKTWISGVRRSTGIRYYAIYRKSDHQLIAQSHSLYVWVNLETMRPIRIPEKFLNSFRMNIAIGTEVPA